MITYNRLALHVAIPYRIFRQIPVSQGSQRRLVLARSRRLIYSGGVREASAGVASIGLVLARLLVRRALRCGRPQMGGKGHSCPRLPPPPPCSPTPPLKSEGERLTQPIFRATVCDDSQMPRRNSAAWAEAFVLTFGRDADERSALISCKAFGCLLLPCLRGV